MTPKNEGAPQGSKNQDKMTWQKDQLAHHRSLGIDVVLGNSAELSHHGLPTMLNFCDRWSRNPASSSFFKRPAGQEALCILLPNGGFMTPEEEERHEAIRSRR
jgi:hypothetical protein